MNMDVVARDNIPWSADHSTDSVQSWIHSFYVVFPPETWLQGHPQKSYQSLLLLLFFLSVPSLSSLSLSLLYYISLSCSSLFSFIHFSLCLLSLFHSLVHISLYLSCLSLFISHLLLLCLFLFSISVLSSLITLALNLSFSFIPLFSSNFHLSLSGTSLSFYSSFPSFSTRPFFQYFASCFSSLFFPSLPPSLSILFLCSKLFFFLLFSHNPLKVVHLLNGKLEQVSGKLLSETP